MQRVVRVGGLAMARADVQAAQHLQAGCFVSHNRQGKREEFALLSLYLYLLSNVDLKHLQEQ